MYCIVYGIPGTYFSIILFPCFAQNKLKLTFLIENMTVDDIKSINSSKKYCIFYQAKIPLQYVLAWIWSHAALIIGICFNYVNILNPLYFCTVRLPK